ncbi:30S ribosomal protein S8 [Patescibacteria group bacterium]|nr:30S ribosomal protein S8 [Patescibacteria group bacterium]
MVTDPVADTLISVKNGYLASRVDIRMPYTKMRESILKVLKQYGFVEDYKKNTDGKFPVFIVYLYEKGKLTNVKQISKPGCRVYINAKDIPVIRDGFGICVLSTSKGVMSGEEAKKKKLGGELLAKVW